MLETIKGLLSGAVDIHLHATPDIYERSQNILEIARDAACVGMKAIVYKTHDFITAGFGNIVSNIVPNIQVFGGCALNYASGGFNAQTVEVTAKLGGKTVWMPTMDSEWFYQQMAERASKEPTVYSRFLKSNGAAKAGLCIFEAGINDPEYRIKPEVIDVLEAISKNNLILETGHLSPRETLVLIDEARSRGVKKVLCTHVNNPNFGLTSEQQVVAVKKGACLMFSFTPFMATRGAQHPKQVLEMMRRIGVNNCVIATDFGSVDLPKPVEGMRLFIANLLQAGAKENEIDNLVKVTPCKLLGI